MVCVVYRFNKNKERKVKNEMQNEKSKKWKGEVPEGDRLNYAAKSTVKWINQRSLKYMYNNNLVC